MRLQTMRTAMQSKPNPKTERAISKTFLILAGASFLVFWMTPLDTSIELLICAISAVVGILSIAASVYFDDELLNKNPGYWPDRSTLFGGIASRKSGASTQTGQESPKKNSS
jgi:hypothetical protein